MATKRTMATANMDKETYRPETAYEDWPIWIFRFENFLALNEVKYTEAEGKVLAAKHLIHAGGDALTMRSSKLLMRWTKSHMNS